MQNFDGLRLPGVAERWQDVAERGEVPLLLVRHGRTALNAERRFLGRLDVPLDEVGEQQAASVQARLATLPRAGLYASPLSRAAQTARRLGEPVLIDGLMELDQGALEGLDGPTAYGRFPEFFAGWQRDPAEVRVPGGETLAECQARSIRTLHTIASAHTPGPPVVIVSHQMVLVSALLHALNQPLARFRELYLGNCSVSVVAFSAQRLRVVSIDDRTHISGPSQGL